MYKKIIGTIIVLGLGFGVAFGGVAWATAEGSATAVPATKPQSTEPQISKKVSKKAPTVVLDVLLLNDPDFQEISEDDARQILKNGRETLSDKLGFDDLHFNFTGSRSVQAFISDYADSESECVRDFQKLRTIPGGRSAFDVDRAHVIAFLKRWPLKSLRSFFPEEKQEALVDYETIAEILLVELDRKVKLISNFKLKDGQSLLAADKIPKRSYVHWICALREQDEADLILTNEFILYDLASEPYPHSVFHKCKVGGASLASPKRKAIRGRAVVSSTFSMVTKLPFFKEDGVDDLSADERLAVIGAFIVAHELGHALFKLPDFYDHPPECLMTTKYETGYVSGFYDLRAHPGQCSMCEPYVKARAQVFLGQLKAREGEHSEAIDHLKNAIRSTPKHIDGNYYRYLADISSDIAASYSLLGNIKQAKRWLRSTLRLVPNHAQALKLKKDLEAGTIPVSATKKLEDLTIPSAKTEGKQNGE